MKAIDHQGGPSRLAVGRAVRFGGRGNIILNIYTCTKSQVGRLNDLFDKRAVARNGFRDYFVFKYRTACKKHRVDGWWGWGRGGGGTRWNRPSRRYLHRVPLV